MVYTLETVIQSDDKLLRKKFKTRDAALNFLEKILDTNNLQIEKINRVQENKHNIEYYCNDFNRFFIKRTTLK